MNNQQLYELLGKVKNSEIAVEDAAARLRDLPFEDISFARLDHHRQIRCGFAEVIYCKGKAISHIVEIFTKLAAKQHNVLATRAEKEVFDAIRATDNFPNAQYDELARTILLEQQKFAP